MRPVGRFDAEFDDTYMFLVGQGGRLACGPTRKHAVATFFDLPVYKGLEVLLVDPPVTERGDQGGN